MFWKGFWIDFGTVFGKVLEWFWSGFGVPNTLNLDVPGSNPGAAKIH